MFDYKKARSDQFGLNPTPNNTNFLVLTADHMLKRINRFLEPEFKQLVTLTVNDPQSLKEVTYEEIYENSIQKLPIQEGLYGIFEQAAKYEKEGKYKPEQVCLKIDQLIEQKRAIEKILINMARDMAVDYVSKQTGMDIHWLLIEDFLKLNNIPDLAA